MLAARSVAHVRPIRLLLDESRSDFIGLAPLSICPVSRLRQLGDMTRVGPIFRHLLLNATTVR